MTSSEVDFSKGVRGKHAEHLEVYSSGSLHCSVCTDITDKKEILRRVNAEHPCGTDNGWVFSKDTQWAAGKAQPSPCPDHEGRTHYLMDA